MEQKFKTGDHVQMVSGGPSMTVVKYEPDNGLQVTCQWFDKDQNLQEKSFHQDTLNKYAGMPAVFSGGRVDSEFGF